MTSIQIDNEEPELPGEEIRRHRDFSKVQSRYRGHLLGVRRRKPYRLKNRFYFLFMLLLLLLLILLFS
ncbi:MAG: hypothetical protein IBJ09_08475 [Bacteroidia bacterium]|nr:hypothetical protein [Bacteroidia bacterium]